jgi:hypothetical protein
LYYKDNHHNEQSHWLNELYKAYPPFDPIKFKCFYGTNYLTKYLYDVKNSRTNFYTGLYDTAWKSFAVYSYLGFAPDSIQEYSWSNLLIVLSQFKNREINLEKTFDIYENKFPTSEYTTILRGLIKAPEKFKGKYIDAKPLTIKALWQNHFQGKAVFIDLWATWCVPCIGEFHYSRKLYDFLVEQNIKILYLSMDDAKAKVK